MQVMPFAAREDDVARRTVKPLEENKPDGNR